MKSKVVALTLGLGILCSSFPGICRGESYEERTGTIVADVIVYRPTGVLLTVSGTALFLVIFPATLIAGGTKSTAHTLVTTPFRFTFCRPIGTDLRDYVDDY
jgi:hypothetical protein